MGYGHRIIGKKHFLRKKEVGGVCYSKSKFMSMMMVGKRRCGFSLKGSKEGDG